MYKKVTTDDIFRAADTNREAPSTPTPKKTVVDTPPVTQNGNATEAEKIRAMGDRLSKIWES
jgi:CBS domain-containing protein